MSHDLSKPAQCPLKSQQADVDTEQMVRDNVGWMLGLAERLLRDRALAEDAVQEAFIAAFRGLEKFEGRSSLKTWLHRITVNASLTQLRKRKRQAASRTANGCITTRI